MDDVKKLTTDDPIKLVIANKNDLVDKIQVFDNDMKVSTFLMIKLSYLQLKLTLR